jgi:hypothetical protein
MQRYPKAIIMIIINHDYKGINNIHIVLIHHNMKLNSMFEHNDQAITHFQGCRKDSNQ